MARRSFGYIRKLPSGKHQASFTSPSGGRSNAPYTFLTRGDASAWLAAQEVAISSGKWEPSGTIDDEHEENAHHNFLQYAERHIRLQTNTDGSLLRESTRNLYRRLLRVNLRSFHSSSIESITSATISEWWAEAIEGGKKTAASKAYKLLSATLKRAVGEKLIASNPCLVSGAQGATTGKVISIPSLDEVRLIAKNINPRYSRMVILMAFGGFRFGEITELRRGDVSDAIINGRRAYVFNISRAVTLVGTETGRGFHKVDKPKSRAGTRAVNVPSKLTPMVDELMSALPSNEKSLLFPSASNPERHLRHDVFMNSWRQALKRSMIRDGAYSPHCLRHFAGSHLHLAGANIPELKQWLGDSSTAAVMRYVHSTGRTSTLPDGMLSEEIEWRV